MRAKSSLRGELSIAGLTMKSIILRTDPAIFKHYNAKEFQKGKDKKKNSLTGGTGPGSEPEIMMVGMCSRLTDQKGLDLVSYVMDDLCQDTIQLVVLGTGDAQYENMFRHFAWKYGNKVSANIYYSGTDVTQVYASAMRF